MKSKIVIALKKVCIMALGAQMILGRMQK